MKIIGLNKNEIISVSGGGQGLIYNFTQALTTAGKGVSDGWGWMGKNEQTQAASFLFHTALTICAIGLTATHMAYRFGIIDLAKKYCTDLTTKPEQLNNQVNY